MPSKAREGREPLNMDECRDPKRLKIKHSDLERAKSVLWQRESREKASLKPYQSSSAVLDRVAQ